MTPAHLTPVPPRRTAAPAPGRGLERLADQLPDGTRTTLRTDGTLAVLATPAASIWCNGRTFWWATPDGEVTWSAADTEGAARRLAGHGRHPPG